MSDNLSLLEVENVSTSYGSSQVLFNVSLRVRQGEVVTLLGRNGMGKTTLVKTIIGMLKPGSGSLNLAGQDLIRLPSHRIAQLGVGLVPEGRRIFPNLTVHENLVATARARAGARASWAQEDVYGMFPRLKERAGNFGNQLSGGEQQMLAIGRALMINPRLLILDEATEGLAPVVRDEIWSGIRRLKETGLSLVLIDKNIRSLMRLADRHYVMEKGRIAWSGSSEALSGDPELLRTYLSV